MDCKTNIRCWQMKLSLRPQLVSDQSHPLVPSNRAQFSLPPGKFQKETVTVFPSIHFQFFGSVVSRMAPSQYCPLASPYVLHKKYDIVNHNMYQGAFTIYVQNWRQVGGYQNVNDCKRWVGRWSDNYEYIFTKIQNLTK